LQFFSCISADQFASCSSLCDTADPNATQTFAACVESAQVGQCEGVDCYYAFDTSAQPGPTPKQVSDCKQSCSNLAFFHCITGTEAASCASACETYTKAEIEAFLICTTNPTDCSGVAQCL
jgi:hypothetical protein